MISRTAAGAFLTVAVGTSCAAIAGLNDPDPIGAADEGGGPDGASGGDGAGADGGGISDDGDNILLTNDAGIEAGPLCDETGLIAHWRFQEGAGTRVFDCTSGAHHGDFVNGPTWAAGRAGRKAVSFDGTAGMEIDVVDKPDLQLTGAMTIVVWAYVRSASTDGRFLSKGGDVPDRGWDVKLEANDGSLELRIANDGSNQTSLYALNFPLSTWKHVAAVYVPGSSPTMKLYIDAVNVAALFGGPTAQYNSPDHVVIGARTGCCTLNGMLDDMRLYNRALSDGEITTLYNGSK